MSGAASVACPDPFATDDEGPSVRRSRARARSRERPASRSDAHPAQGRHAGVRGSGREPANDGAPTRGQSCEQARSRRQACAGAGRRERARRSANRRWHRGLLLSGLLFAGAVTAEPLLGHWSSDCDTPGAEIDIHLYAVGESLWQVGIIQRVAEATGRVDAPPTRVAIKRRGERVVLLAIEESIPPAAAVMLRAVRVDDDRLQLTGQRACTGEDCTTSYGRTVLKRCADSSG